MEKLKNGADPPPLLVLQLESKPKLSSPLGISITLCLAGSDVVKQVANYSLQVSRVKLNDVTKCFTKPFSYFKIFTS